MKAKRQTTKRPGIRGVLIGVAAVAVVVGISAAVKTSDKRQTSASAVGAGSGGVIGEAGKPQTVDPFSGKPVKMGVYADHGGQRVYFCCPTSREKFLADPQGYVRRMRERGIILASTPAQ
jgi:YHS domain-containing protein